MKINGTLLNSLAIIFLASAGFFATNSSRLESLRLKRAEDAVREVQAQSEANLKLIEKIVRLLERDSGR